MPKDNLKLLMREAAKNLLKKKPKASDDSAESGSDVNSDHPDDEKQRLLELIPLLSPKAIGTLLWLAELSIQKEKANKT